MELGSGDGCITEQTTNRCVVHFNRVNIFSTVHYLMVKKTIRKKTVSLCQDACPLPVSVLSFRGLSVVLPTSPRCCCLTLTGGVALSLGLGMKPPRLLVCHVLALLSLRKSACIFRVLVVVLCPSHLYLQGTAFRKHFE